MYSRIRCRHGRTAARFRRSVPVAMAIAAAAAAVLPAQTAAAAAHPAFVRLTYLRHSFVVPRDWRVINLREHPRTCVRFDRHIIYLGTPSPNQACPSSAIGTTEAMLIEPAARHAAQGAVENPTERRITVTTRRLHIVATFDKHPEQIRRMLASAGLPHPADDPDRPQPATLAASLPAGVTSYRGLGFDTCTAPSETAMQAWRAHSPYGAVGIYIGGSDSACAQPNLTPGWLAATAAQGWHFIPMYVGPQAAFGELQKAPAGQGTAAANDAATQAEQLGFGPQTPIYYDMESYPAKESGRVLQFLAAWTTRLHALGYLSGVYSSSSTGISDLARQAAAGNYPVPDVIFDALWNGQANTQDSVLQAGQWAHQHRAHQYTGNVSQTYGGTTIVIDQDYLDIELLPKSSPDTPGYPAGAASSRYSGAAFDTCTAPALAAMRAWRSSPFHAAGVYIGGINRACGQPHLTASWVTSVSELHWRLLPLYVGLQPSCRTGADPAGVAKNSALAIDGSIAASQGAAAADSAAARARALGLLPGSIIYDYIEQYSPAHQRCQSAVLGFVSGWARELHRLGFLAGVYASLASGGAAVASRYPVASFGRPDAIWVASWDGDRSLTGWAGITGRQWALHQRAKQYQGPHNASYGGTTIRMASDNVDAPAATVGYGYKVASPAGLNARTGPAKSYRIVKTYPPHATVQVVCQAPGSAIFSTDVWDKLSNGSYVSDYYLNTPSKTGYSVPLPRCAYPYQVANPGGIRERTGLGWSHRVSGELPYGGLAWVVCQQAGPKDGTSPVWDDLLNGQWIPDFHLATPSRTGYSGPALRC